MYRHVSLGVAAQLSVWITWRFVFIPAVLRSVWMTNGGELTNRCCGITGASLCERGYSQPPQVLPLPVWDDASTFLSMLCFCSLCCLQVAKKKGLLCRARSSGQRLLGEAIEKVNKITSATRAGTENLPRVLHKEIYNNLNKSSAGLHSRQEETGTVSFSHHDTQHARMANNVITLEWRYHSIEKPISLKSLLKNLDLFFFFAFHITILLLLYDFIMCLFFFFICLTVEHISLCVELPWILLNSMITALWPTWPLTT